MEVNTYMHFLYLDTETTGTDPGARLVQLAYKNSATGTIVNEYFKPPVKISYGAMAVHHITHEMVEDKPAFAGSECRKTLVNELEHVIVVAHNAAFDIGILKNEGVIINNHIDTVRLSRHVVEGAEQHALQYLRYFLGLNVAGTAHDALGDILVLEALFEYLQKKVAEKYNLTDEAQVYEKILELNQQPTLLNTIRFGKYKGKTYAEVAKSDKAYLEWLYGSETQKNEIDQNPELVFTLRHYLAS